MAQRPIFIAETNECRVREAIVDFEWVPGMALSQAQKCIRSLHTASRAQYGVGDILEISSKSESPEGVALSAFNLCLDIEGIKRPVESVYQASKMFHGGGPYEDLLAMSLRDAKRDERLRLSGPVVGFRYSTTCWAVTPKTAFYDWLYIRALNDNPMLAKRVRSAEAFTDIAFNPARSVSCQARSAALFSVLAAANLLTEAIASQESFLEHHAKSLGRVHASTSLFGD